MSNEEIKRPHIVVVGAGFGGLRAAQKLAKAKVDVTLVDRNNYHLFQPLLYQVSTACLSIDDVAYPVRATLRDQSNANFRLAIVESVDLEAKKLMTDNGEISYDYLLMAAGATTNFFGMQNLEKHAFGMKTLEESVQIRSHILRQFELAAHEKDPIKRKALLTFVVVGGGPTGVEEAGALSELIYLVMEREYHTLNFKEVRIVLVEATDKLLPMMPEKLRDTTVETLIRKHVEVRLCVQVMDYDGKELKIKGGEVIPTNTVIWAAGVRAVGLADTMQCEQDRAGRIMVNECLQVPTHPEVFVIGDMAHFMQDGAPLATVAPVAMQQATTAAENIIHSIEGKELEKFRFKPVGAMATIGRNEAVVSMGSYKSSGFTAWMIWLVVHIWRLIGFRNKIVVFVKWMWDYLLYDRLIRIITR